jgi:hypothetical protein
MPERVPGPENLGMPEARPGPGAQSADYYFLSFLAW